MNLLELIEEDAYSFSLNNTFGEIKLATKQSKNSHFPIFDNENFVGMLNKKNVLSFDANIEVGAQKLDINKFFINDNQSVLDAINFYEINKSNILPVLDAKFNFLGIIKQKKVFKSFSSNFLFSGYGETILIETDENKFSMKEISNIIEYNNGKVIGIFITNIKNNKVEICVKFTSATLNAVGDTFERYNYKIVNKFFNDFKQEIMNERYNYLINYIKS